VRWGTHGACSRGARAGGPDERLTPRAAAWFLLLLSPLLFDSEALHTHL
jgi:hypothetical protein